VPVMVKNVKVPTEIQGVPISIEVLGRIKKRAA
jgi:hypothetical protein